MEQKLQNLLDELERAGAANDTLETDRSRKMLNLESDTARLIAILARASSATRVIEIGTSNGYSTIWLAWAVAPAGGRVISIEKSPQKHAMAEKILFVPDLRTTSNYGLVMHRQSHESYLVHSTSCFSTRTA